MCLFLCAVLVPSLIAVDYKILCFFDDVDVDVDSYASLIKESTFKSVSISDIVGAQMHLLSEEYHSLSNILNKHTTLFDGPLKLYPHCLVHVDMIPNAIPWRLQTYPVAHIHLEVFKAKLIHLCNIGVSEICGASQWASQTFITPKKDGTFCWVSDFRELNKVIQRHIYPLPHIKDILNHCSGYSFFSKLDVSIQYFTFELDADSQRLLKLSKSDSQLPLGLYRMYT
jgi:hypothetical protein